MLRLPPQLLSLFSSWKSLAPEGCQEEVAAPSPSAPRRLVAQAPLPVWTRLYSPGGVVVHEGDPGDSVFLIVEGRVAVMCQSQEGDGIPVRQLVTGDFFGELALVAGTTRTATVVAMERTVLLELSRAGLVEAGARHGLEHPRLQMVAQERLVADALRLSPLLASLPRELVIQLGSALVPYIAVPGEPILTHGQPGDALYVLLRGRCAVFHPHEDGDTTSYPDLEEGAVFGEVSLLRSRVATATVEAVTPCMLLRLDRDVFRQFFRSQPALRRALVKLGLERLRRTTRLVVDERRPIQSY